MGKFITFTVKKFISIIQNLNTFVDIPKDDIDKICETEKIFQLAEKIMSSFLLSLSFYDLMGINELENCLVLLQTIVSYHTIPLGTIISKNYDCGKTLVQLDKLIVEFSDWIREMILVFKNKFCVPDNFSEIMLNYFNQLYELFVKTLKIECPECPECLYTVLSITPVKTFQPPGVLLSPPISISCHFEKEMYAYPPQDYRNYFILNLGQEIYILVHPSDMDNFYSKRVLFIRHYTFLWISPRKNIRVFLANLF